MELVFLRVSQQSDYPLHLRVELISPAMPADEAGMFFARLRPPRFDDAKIPATAVGTFKPTGRFAAKFGE